jgi:hypothetical protein
LCGTVLKPHGHGKCTYGDDELFEKGVVYEGDWVDGMMEGKGKIAYPSGGLYSGDFVKNSR